MTLRDAVRLLELAGFATLASVSLVRWWRVRGEAAGWVAATFAALAGAVLAARFLPEAGVAADGGHAALARAVVLVLVAFPYCVF
ncbi:MAG: hypothetical protein ACRD03_10865, partial [Acidimicrobiales bacterium]